LSKGGRKRGKLQLVKHKKQAAHKYAMATNRKRKGMKLKKRDGDRVGEQNVCSQSKCAAIAVEEMLEMPS